MSKHVFENWVVFPEEIEIPIVTTDLYKAYKLDFPNRDIIDEKMITRLGPYLLTEEEQAAFNYEEYRQNNIVIFVSISPRLKKGWSVEYGLFRAALEIAAEESTGTWDPELKTLLPSEMDDDSKANMEVLRAKVIGLNINSGMSAVALPVEGFEAGNIPQVLSVIMGNYTGMASSAHGVRFDDVDFPDKFADTFLGPTIGNEGLRKILGNNLTVGTIVKPKTGLSEADWAKTSTRSFMGGLDVVKDDENLTSQDYCTFDNRAKLVFKGIKEVKEKTGRDVVYVANITHGDFDEMIRRADLVKSLGGNCLMIDILATGITAVHTINKKYPEMLLHGHRAGHGAQTIFPEPIIDGVKYSLRQGISMKVWVIISRLAGIDQMHIGAPKGKMELSAHTVLENLEGCLRPLGNIKPCRAICSGGLKNTVMWDVAKIMNPVGDEPNLDIIFQAGGGTHSHPGGTFAGAKSLVQARDAVKKGLSPEWAMANHFECLHAFRRWDNEVYGAWLATLKADDKVVIEYDLRPYYKNGDYKEEGPQPVDLKTAVSKFPELKVDIEKFNSDIAKSL